MGKKKIEETRDIELSIPQEVMANIAEIIEQNEMGATILGRSQEKGCITIGFDYAPQHWDSIMEILELIEDHNSDEDEEGEEEAEED